MTAGRCSSCDAGVPRGWSYHVRTLGSVLILTAVVLLIAAGIGLLAADAFNSGTTSVPGTGVTPIPTPQWAPTPR